MMDPRTIPELTFHMPTVARLATNDWARNFAASIVKQSRRRGWRPSPKQEAIMRELVSDLFRESVHLEDDVILIE